MTNSNLFVLASAIIFVILTCIESYAGVGGIFSSSGNAKGSLLKIILIGLFFVIASPVLFFIWLKKKGDAISYEKVIKKLQKDFNIDIDKSVENIFINLHEAWGNNDLSSMKNYLTRSLYNEYDKIINGWKVKNYKNIIRNVTLLSKEKKDIIKASEHDYIITYIFHATMIDYLEDTNTGEVVKGKKEKGRLKLIWSFLVNGEGVKLSSIGIIE